MVFQASGTRQYFLGIAGQQTGPHSDAEVLEKIRAGEVPADALVWYEGLPEWQAINTIEFFKEAFSASPDLPAPDAVNVPVNSAPRPAAPEKKIERKPAAAPGTAKARPPGEPGKGSAGAFLAGDSVGPLFSNDEAEPGRGNTSKILLGAGLALAVVGGGAYLMMGGDSPIIGEEPAAPAVKAPKKVVIPVTNARQDQLRTASAELGLNPTGSIETMKKLVREKADDDAGKEALSQLLSYYKQNQKPLEAGSLLMELKRPHEAYKFFLQDSSNAAKSQAETALFQAYEQTTEPSLKRQFLLEDVELLIALERMEQAIERIRLLAKSFPNTPNPYSYYLKTSDEKIAELFGKVSNYFVNSLLAFASSEFPDMHLEGRPTVEVQFEKPANYRIAARYKGKVKLRQDLLDDIHFTFWMVDTNWIVVDTNLTTERQRWSAGNRLRYKDKFLTSNLMLQYLQGIFRAQYPEVPFHESGHALTTNKRKKRDE